MEVYESYIKSVADNIKNVSVKKKISRKIHKRLRIRTDELLHQFDNKESAAQSAVEEIGDAKALAARLEMANKPKRGSVSVVLAFMMLIAIFLYVNGFNTISYINLVDWFEHDLSMDWTSTLLFFGMAVLIAAGIKTRSKALFWLMAIFMIAGQVVSFFTGFFQPLWFSWVSIITRGWSGYLIELSSRSEPDSIPGLIMGLLGFLTDLLISVLCIISVININLEQNGTDKPGQWQKVKSASFAVLIFSIISVVIIFAGTYTGYVKQKPFNEAVRVEIIQNQNQALLVYNGLGPDEIRSTLEKGFKYEDFSFGNSQIQIGLNDNREPNKRLYAYQTLTINKKSIELLQTGMTLESFIEHLPLSYSDEINCTYLTSGQTEESFGYSIENWFSHEYYTFIFIDNKLANIDYDKTLEFNNKFLNNLY